MRLRYLWLQQLLVRYRQRQQAQVLRCIDSCWAFSIKLSVPIKIFVFLNLTFLPGLFPIPHDEVFGIYSGGSTMSSEGLYHPAHIFCLWSYINVSENLIDYDFLLSTNVLLIIFLLPGNYLLKFFVQLMADCSGFVRRSRHAANQYCLQYSVLVDHQCVFLSCSTLEGSRCLRLQLMVSYLRNCFSITVGRWSWRRTVDEDIDVWLEYKSCPNCRQAYSCLPLEVKDQMVDD